MKVCLKILAYVEIIIQYKHEKDLLHYALQKYTKVLQEMYL